MSDEEGKEGESTGGMESEKEEDAKGRNSELLQRAEKELFETQVQLKAKVHVYTSYTNYMYMYIRT